MLWGFWYSIGSYTHQLWSENSSQQSVVEEPDLQQAPIEVVLNNEDREDGYKTER